MSDQSSIVPLLRNSKCDFRLHCSKRLDFAYSQTIGPLDEERNFTIGNLCLSGMTAPSECWRAVDSLTLALEHHELSMNGTEEEFNSLVARGFLHRPMLVNARRLRIVSVRPCFFQRSSNNRFLAQLRCGSNHLVDAHLVEEFVF